MNKMDSQQYCLKWNHHQSNLLKVFSRLLDNEQFTDVLLATEGKTIRCHKVVLSACSSYFENLFMTYDEKNQIVILKDTTYDDVFCLVEFMYRGEINVAQNQLASLMKTADNLKIKGLSEVSSQDQSSGALQTTATASTITTGAASLIPTSSSKVTNATPSSSSTASSNGSGISISSGAGVPPSSPKKLKVLDLSTTAAGSSSSTEPLIMKRKRGRPRILDAPGEINPFAQIIEGSKSAMPSSSLDLVTSTNKPETHDDNSNEPTPGGPLTNERIKELGIIKMNDYLATGTRQQFWEEYYVKVVMQAVRNKEIDMKTGAEILGVSYGTLYGRYRETFGYLKHAWNAGGGRPTRPGASYGSPSMVPASSVIDAGSLHILEQLKFGKINVRQAADLLKVDPTILAYELAAKAMRMDPLHGDQDHGDVDDEEEEYHDMEVQPDVVLHDDLDDEEDDEDDIAEPDDEDVDPEPGRPHIRPISPPRMSPPLELVGPVRPVGPVGRVGPVGHHVPMSVKNEDPDPIATN